MNVRTYTFSNLLLTAISFLLLHGTTMVGLHTPMFDTKRIFPIPSLLHKATPSCMFLYTTLQSSPLYQHIKSNCSTIITNQITKNITPTTSTIAPLPAVEQVKNIRDIPGAQKCFDEITEKNGFINAYIVPQLDPRHAPTWGESYQAAKNAGKIKAGYTNFELTLDNAFGAIKKDVNTMIFSPNSKNHFYPLYFHPFYMYNSEKKLSKEDSPLSTEQIHALNDKIVDDVQTNQGADFTLSSSQGETIVHATSTCLGLHQAHKRRIDLYEKLKKHHQIGVTLSKKDLDFIALHEKKGLPKSYFIKPNNNGVTPAHDALQKCYDNTNIYQFYLEQGEDVATLKKVLQKCACSQEFKARMTTLFNNYQPHRS